jgi:protein TonB
VHLNRNFAIAGSVIVFHAALIWAIQSGLMRRAVEVIVPVEMLSSIITPPAPKIETPPPPPPVPPPPPPSRQPVAAKTRPAPAPAPQPMAIADPTPAPNAPTGVTTPPAPLSPIQAPVAVAAAPAAPAAPARVEQPSSDAAYLNNPSPVYPAVSRRMGEQGKVLVRVLIGADGVPQKADIATSSGFARLDQSALEYVMKCRYVPGKVGGVAQAMTHIAPVNFVLN